MTTNEVGRITEAKVLARLIEIGKHVLTPFSNIGRYDLLIDDRDGKFIRVECKTGRFSKGCLIFNTSSRGGYKHLPGKDYSKDADMFGIWCSVTDKVYLVPVSVAASGSMMLRIEEPNERSNHSKIKYAKDFQI